MRASTTALPPSTCTARREAGRLHHQAAVVFAARPANCWLLFRGLSRTESAPAVFACSALFSRLFVCLLASAFAMSTAHLKFACPCSFASVHFHVRQDRHSSKQHVCKLLDCPVGSCNTGLQWRPVRRFLVDSPSFSCRVHDPGPWVSVRFIRLSCLCKYECTPPACLCLSAGILFKLSA